MPYIARWWGSAGWSSRFCEGDKGTTDKPRKTLLVFGLCVLLSAVLLSACAITTPPATPALLRLAGANSMAPLLEELSQAFSAQRSDVILEVQSGNTALGLSLLARGEVELAAASWLPSELPSAWVATPIAWDGLAIIVHPSNPVDGLTLFQLRRVFAGWAFHWQDVGAPIITDEALSTIQVISREDGSGTRAVFEQQVMGNERVTFTALVMPTSQAVVEYIAEHENAIGYVSMAWADDRVKVLRIEGLLPTPETVRGGYHLAYPLYLVTRDQPTGLIKAFLDFVLSPAGQSIVGKRYGRVR